MTHRHNVNEILNEYGEYGNGKINGDEIAKRLPNYNSIIDFLSDDDNCVIVDPADIDAKKQSLTHQRLKKFVSEEIELSRFGLSERDRVSILIPNGAIAAVAIVALLHRWCVAPINPASTYSEIRDELASTKSRCILVLKEDPVGKIALKAAEELNIGAMILIPDTNTSGLFRIELVRVIKDLGSKPPIVAKTVKDLNSLKHPETVLLLHTSGTSGNKKLVPYTLDMIVIGVSCIIKSWNLSSVDVCLNMMPLFHIGGIMRNVLSPLLSGGCVITCSGFDPFLFWNIVYSNQRVTWYYASPTMHHALLQESQNRSKPLPVQDIRFVANAAGGLLPVLAQSLKDTFQATILTSYGMTECMPISSPPQNYNLNPSGTSGIPVGPTVIIVDDSMVTQCPPNVKGNILIKGEPCFGGYENNEGANAESFYTVDGVSGWFDTGDCGMLDENNYLFISGRSKEIINRGGETISPFEIEEVIVQHPHVKETLAFSAPHETYQEVVGCVIVTKKDLPRVDLVNLHQYLDGKLHRSKWPMVIVYMDSLPKNLTGKILRIKLADRLCMGDVDENLPSLLRLYDATAPAIGAPLTQKIPMINVPLDTCSIDDVLKLMGDAKTVLVDLSFKTNALVSFVSPSEDQYKQVGNVEEIKLHLQKLCVSKLHMYLQPSFIHIIDNEKFSNTKDFKALAHSISTLKPVSLAKSKTEQLVLQTWKSHLNLTRPLGVDDNFFDLGGDSLKAGQLVSVMRRTFGIYNLSVGDLLNAPTIEAISSRIDEIIKASNQSLRAKSNWVATGKKHSSLNECTDRSDIDISCKDTVSVSIQDMDLETGKFIDSSRNDSDSETSANKQTSMNTIQNNNWTCILVQLLPLGFVYPFKYASKFFLFISIWQQLVSSEIVNRFVGLILAALFVKFILLVIAPFVVILLKWVVIGRYKAGTYPLWGSYYLRWWFVHHVSKIFGFGVFGMDLPLIGSMIPLYYSLLGAKIGKNVKIAKNAVIGEPDLLTIDDGAWVDVSNVRPFTLEESAFSLLPIRLGKNCVIGKKCFVHAGAVIQDDVCLGPCSSSHEQHDATPENRQYCQFALPSCSSMFLRLCVKFPITLAINILCRAPYIMLVYLMVMNSIQNGYGIESFESIKYVVHWWATPQRFIFYYAIAITAQCFTPFLHLFFVILVKWFVIGTFVPMTAEEKSLPWNAMRYSLMNSLMSGDSLGGVTKLVGSHYEIVSIIYRLLGAKVGKRVYWPGSGIHIVEYDLLEVGNDVVFGSRSFFMTSSGNKSDKIILGDGCMIADRCVLMPGVNIGRCAVLGSGGLAKEDMKLPIGSVYVGSRNGCAVMAQPEDLSYLNSDTITPFGKAFYNHQASYFVIPLWMVVCYNCIWQAFCISFQSTPLLMSIYFANAFVIEKRVLPYSSYTIYAIILTFYIWLNFGSSIIALSIEIAGKWLVMGRRVAGEYRWDKSSYCQRWQIYITLQSIRAMDKCSILELIEGSYFLVLFFKALGCTIGRNVCLYPNGGDPMMTEPDLVTLGDNVSVDEASLIAHINTRGEFRLNKLSIGNGCVLKSGSRLLSGANMESRSMMLEHTLVMSGETCDSETVWQGWPSNTITSLYEYQKSKEFFINKNENSDFNHSYNFEDSFEMSSPEAVAVSVSSCTVVGVYEKVV